MHPDWVCMGKKIIGQASLHWLLAIIYDLFLLWCIFFKVNSLLFFWKSLIQTELEILVLIGILITLIHTSLRKSKYRLTYVFLFFTVHIDGINSTVQFFWLFVSVVGSKIFLKSWKLLTLKNVHQTKNMSYHIAKSRWRLFWPFILFLMHTQSKCIQLIDLKKSVKM